ncbi:hypothetical protein BCR36DRAFT_441016 [Piromyces finnis]|uniref:Uncharacterized protein n=1 Tax=Piromyces finnis TaxID=1754191 RepID=A0A1Y1VF96_9FUNG|nr:hypothetical protein BCR36DRAFT_441016 [Piromyces finnis]|eukprot:ORX54240.1 hypothetical protein BCR36DRAFT_441016 [Piromyces finnis]
MLLLKILNNQYDITNNMTFKHLFNQSISSYTNVLGIKKLINTLNTYCKEENDPLIKQFRILQFNYLLLPQRKIKYIPLIENLKSHQSKSLSAFSNTNNMLIVQKKVINHHNNNDNKYLDINNNTSIIENIFYFNRKELFSPINHNHSNFYKNILNNNNRNQLLLLNKNTKKEEKTKNNKVKNIYISEIKNEKGKNNDLHEIKNIPNSNILTLINKDIKQGKNNTKLLIQKFGITNNNKQEIIKLKKDKKKNKRIEKITKQKIYKRSNRSITLLELIEFEERHRLIIKNARVLDYNDCVITKN